MEEWKKVDGSGRSTIIGQGVSSPLGTLRGIKIEATDLFTCLGSI